MSRGPRNWFSLALLVGLAGCHKGQTPAHESTAAAPSPESHVAAGRKARLVDPDYLDVIVLTGNGSSVDVAPGQEAAFQVPTGTQVTVLGPASTPGRDPDDRRYRVRILDGDDRGKEGVVLGRRLRWDGGQP